MAFGKEDMDKLQPIGAITGVRMTDRYSRWVVRAKIHNSTEWVVGFYNPIFSQIWVPAEEGKPSNVFLVDPTTVGQRIKVSIFGEEDKFLFEGDVVDWGWIVTWVGRDMEDQEGGNTGMNIGWYIQRDNFESWSEIQVGEEYNVFGNIHDDPELPKKIKEQALKDAKSNNIGIIRG
jgi:hypothetical protein